MTSCGEISRPEPLAYFLTWPTYGTWLPGDQRGWIHHRRGFQLPDPITKMEAKARMSDDACRLNSDDRRVVELTIAAHCQFRNWTLHAVNCRSNHLHVVVSAGQHPDKVREELKAWCTRKLKSFHRERMSQELCETAELRSRWWAERGSKRYINDVDSLEAAIRYVRDAQDKRHQ